MEQSTDKDFAKMLRGYMKQSRKTVAEAKARQFAGGKAIAKATNAEKRRRKSGM